MICRECQDLIWCQHTISQKKNEDCDCMRLIARVLRIKDDINPPRHVVEKIYQDVWWQCEHQEEENEL